MEFSAPHPGAIGESILVAGLRAETYRVVLMLRDIEELSTEEAAQMLGVTANAVKVRLHRARQALRTLLDPHMRSR